jgi:hypothetical protein
LLARRQKNYQKEKKDFVVQRVDGAWYLSILMKKPVEINEGDREKGDREIIGK